MDKTLRSMASFSLFGLQGSWISSTVYSWRIMCQLEQKKKPWSHSLDLITSFFFGFVFHHVTPIVLTVLVANKTQSTTAPNARASVAFHGLTGF